MSEIQANNPNAKFHPILEKTHKRKSSGPAKNRRKNERRACAVWQASEHFLRARENAHNLSV